MYIDKLTVDISAAGTTAGSDVSDAQPITVWITGVTGGGNVDLQISGDGGSTWSTYQAAIVADDYFTITDLCDQVRFVVNNGKANAKAQIRRMRSALL